MGQITALLAQWGKPPPAVPVDSGMSGMEHGAAGRGRA